MNLPSFILVSNAERIFLLMSRAYNSLSTELANSSNQLAKLKVNEATVSSIYTNNDGSFNMSSTLKYDYTVSYQSSGQAQTHSDTATNYITFAYKKVDGKYLKGKTLKLKINGKTIKAKTNKKGVAKLTIKKSVLKKLKAGKKYRYTVTYLKTTVKKTVKVKK